MHVALHYLGICMTVSQWDHACSTTLSGYLYACFTMRSCMHTLSGYHYHACRHYTIWVSVWLFHNESMHVALHYLGICMPVSQWDHACSTTISGYLYACFTTESMHVALHYLGICMPVSQWDHVHVALHYLGICMPVSQWEHACSTTLSGYLYDCFTMRSMHVALHYLGICMPVSQWDHACSTTLSGYLYDCFTMRSCM